MQIFRTLLAYPSPFAGYKTFERRHRFCDALKEASATQQNQNSILIWARSLSQSFLTRCSAEVVHDNVTRIIGYRRQAVLYQVSVLRSIDGRDFCNYCSYARWPLFLREGSHWHDMSVDQLVQCYVCCRGQSCRRRHCGFFATFVVSKRINRRAV